MERIGEKRGYQAMYGQRQREVQKLEGRTVNVAMADGSVLDRVPLILARRGTLWLVADGEEAVVPLHRVVNVSEASPLRTARATL